jgi:hypothetical protein
MVLKEQHFVWKGTNYSSPNCATPEIKQAGHGIFTRNEEASGYHVFYSRISQVLCFGLETSYNVLLFPIFFSVPLKKLREHYPKLEHDHFLP